ncbi:MAG TPA: hypothetical protein VMK83_01140 [Gaiellaceae bacterium]|nr:hypothetical protein [Gaiellaceae bacterium]
MRREIDADDVLLAFEVDVPAMQNDHSRLIRAASLAIQYQRVNAAGRSERAFLRRAAAVLRVDERALDAYVLVLQREIHHCEKTGSSPPTDLPRLTGADRPLRTGRRRAPRPPARLPLKARSVGVRRARRAEPQQHRDREAPRGRQRGLRAPRARRGRLRASGVRLR